MEKSLTIGVIGLGRMGMQIARRLHKNNFNVVAWNRSEGPREELAKFFTSSPPPSPPKEERDKWRGGSIVVDSVAELVEGLPKPKILWLMLPAGELVDEFLFGGSTGSPTNYSLSLSQGDIVIDGGNSFYKDSISRAKKLSQVGIHFFDCGTSGGIHGEQNGFSIMVGGPAPLWPTVEPIFKALAASSNPSPDEGRVAEGREGLHYGLVGPNGAGHFVKMVHNGIEYGMMEAIGEGLGVLKASEFGSKLDFSQVAHIWSKGSVVSSWLIELTKNIFETENLDKVVGLIEHTGEGEWTIKVAKELGVDVRVIEDAFRVRQESSDPTNQEKFSNKIVALLRKRFGGHEVRYKE